MHMGSELLNARPAPHVPVTMAMSSWRRFWQSSNPFTKHNSCFSTRGDITGIKESPFSQTASAAVTHTHHQHNPLGRDR